MKSTRTKKLSFAVLFLLLLGGGAFYFIQTAQGVNRTWDGGGIDGTCGGAGTANNWSCAANWSGDVAPTASDVAIFDATSTKNATINSAVDVAGISINAGYTGTITQSTTNTITVGSSHFVQAAGTFTGGSGDVTLNGNFTLSSGTFTSTTGTLTVGGNWTHTAGGTFNHNNGTVSGNGSGSLDSTYDVATTETFNNFIANRSAYATVVSSGDTLIVLGTFTHTNGPLNTGTIEARGDVVIGASAVGGTTTISFTGPNDQTYTDNGGNEVDGNITINKTANSVTLASTADWNAASQTLTITAGTLLQSSTYAVSTGAVTIGASGKWVNNGTGAVTLGGDLANSGLVDFRSSNTCGGTDSIALHSSTNGVQRAWSGAGTVVMRDIEVKDQGGSASITAYSSTNTSGNGGNWTFNAACPFPIQPKSGLSTGKINMQSGRFNLR